MERFWNFAPDGGANELRLDGEIASETWWGDEVTPALFRADLAQHPGDITVWINSPGGDVFAASSIYTALKEHKGRVTIKIEALAASAASVIAMAGDEVLISPTAYLMIHNPWMLAVGNSDEMRSAAKMLDEVSEGIITAYALKTGQPREKLVKLMNAETWMSAKSAIELGFADGMLYDESEDGAESESAAAAAAAREAANSAATASIASSVPCHTHALPRRRHEKRASSACVFAATTHTDMLIERMLSKAQQSESTPEDTHSNEARKCFELRMKLMRHAIQK